MLAQSAINTKPDDHFLAKSDSNELPSQERIFINRDLRVKLSDRIDYPTKDPEHPQTLRDVFSATFTSQIWCNSICKCGQI